MTKRMRRSARRHYDKQIRLLFDDVGADGGPLVAAASSAAVVSVPSAVVVLNDNNDDDDQQQSPVERFERAQARLLCVEPPLPVVRHAQCELGHHPFVVACTGWPWTKTEYEAWGERTYGSVRAKHQDRYALLADGQGVLRFDPAAAEGDGVIATVLPEAQACRTLRGVLYLLRDGPDKNLVVASLADV
jgi:hypothetical protein